MDGTEPRHNRQGFQSTRSVSRDNDIASHGFGRISRYVGGVAKQLKIGGVSCVAKMLKGHTLRLELSLEGVALRLPWLGSALNLVNLWRLKDAWREESLREVAIPLHRHESRRYSQNGEDGILQWIFDEIGTTNRWFLEIGASDGNENCTRALVEDGWIGAWVEADKGKADVARKSSANRVSVIDSPAEPSNIAEILASVGAPHDPDLVVIDVDGNDWWIAASLLALTIPRVLVIEYNSAYRPGSWWVEPYRKGRRWDESFRHGASLEALVGLADHFGLALVGCDSSGVNSFFVRRDLGSRFSAGGSTTTDSAYVGPWFSSELWGQRRGATRQQPEPSYPFGTNDMLGCHVNARLWPRWGSPIARRGEPVVVAVSVDNATDQWLTSRGDYPTVFAVRWRSRNEEASEWYDEPRVEVPPTAPHTQSRRLLWRIAPREGPGSYFLEITLVQEGVGWFPGVIAAVPVRVT